MQENARNWPVARARTFAARAVSAVALSLVLSCFSAAAAAASNVQYNGGPVSHSMTGEIVEWGSSINATYTNATSGDPGLIKYLAANSGSTGDIGGVLAQYMDSSDHNAANADSYGGAFQIAPSVTSTTISDSQIASELVRQIGQGNLPRPTGDGLSTIYLVLFPAGDTECIDSQTCSGSYFCAYHSSTTLSDGTNVLYAVLPDNTSGPMTQGCGNAHTLFQDQTSYLSHEWSETITDPLGTAWWDSSPGGTGNEIGDWCNQEMGANGSWTVQLEWSNLDGNCVGGESAYSAPTASFLSPSTGSTGQPLSFDASASSDPSQNRASASFEGTSYSISSGITSYRWNWGDGTAATTSSTATASHAFAAAGTYQVSLSVSDSLGFTSTVTRAVTVSGTGVTPTLPSVTTGSASSVDTADATLSGQVNPEGQAVSYQFLYGSSATSLTKSTPLEQGPAGQSASTVTASLSNLNASSTYFYELVVLAAGQTYTGAVKSFTTTAVPTPTPAPQTPIAATAGPTQLTPSGAQLNGSVNPGGNAPVSYSFAYGSSPRSLTSSTPAGTEPGGTASLPVSASIGGLSPGRSYYYRLTVTLGGSSYPGAIVSFTTPAPAPAVSTGGATNVTSSGATIGGVVNPAGLATTYLVEFGTNRTYGHSTAPASAGSGSANVPVSVTLSGLHARTAYHYRLVATNAAGTVVGADETFTTSRALGRAPGFRFSAPIRVSSHAIGERRLHVRFRCSRACEVHFVVTTTSTRLAHAGSVPLTLGRGAGALDGAGTGTATVTLADVPPALLHRHGGLKLVIAGYAVSSGSAPSTPQAVTVGVR